CRYLSVTGDPDDYVAEARPSVFDRLNKWVREDEQECNTHADDGDYVHERCNQEELDLQFRSQLRLTGRAFDQFATKVSERNCGAGTTDAEDDSGSDQRKSLYSFHFYLQVLLRITV